MTKKIIICIFTAIVLSLISCKRSSYETFTGFTQGGVYQVKVNLSNITIPKSQIAHTIDSLLLDIENSISGYKENSLLSKYNRGEDIVPNKYFNDLLSLSEHYHKLTDGAFDVWGAPLFDIWGFGFKNNDFPDEAKIKLALKECKEHKVLNFNAIAQGYTCDIIASYLKSIGVVDMLVDIGEIYCQGLNPKAKGWTIGVDNPVDGNNTPGEDINAVWTSDGGNYGLVTSGNYRKFYIKDGKKYSHTIDTRSGYPVTHNLLSATILAPSAAEADALATACMVLGTQKAQSLILSLDGVEGYLISSDSSWHSPNFYK